MKVLGLTGQTGAGKSTVSQVFSEHGYAVVDCDLVARMVTEPGEPCLQALVEAFGGGILCDDGSLNRKKLAGMAFPQPEKLDLLNRTIHPFILERIKLLLQENTSRGVSVTLLDAPTLFEAGAEKLCDCVLSILAPEQLRLTRIVERDGLTPQQARERMSAQQPDGYYISRSDYVIVNDGDLLSLREKAGRFAQRYRELADEET